MQRRSLLECALVLLLALCVSPAFAHSLAPVPDEIGSTHFTVTLDGVSTPVMYAANHLYFLNFEAGKRVRIAVTAPTDDFWARGVEVQPWRLGIRPTRSGRTISFQLEGVAQISISRPGDFLSNAEMLYLFANPPERNPPSPSAGGAATAAGLQYFGPGVHHGNIDAKSGDTIYLAPGAVVFGGLNLWQVEHVHVFGRGVIVYDGPQNPADDDGWMHKRNWHCIVMEAARDITVEGITCVVRSRTWQIQMKDSHDITFDNIKVIGANAGNANADGMDWLGGGDTVVRNSFFRAADDIFAMQTSWEGYGPKAFAVQGHPVANITVENTVLSTSISNIVRAGWPEKNFEGGRFTLRNSDVLHVGPGGCGIPFALMELWADPNGRGESSGFHFENIRIEDGYSLLQMRQAATGAVSDTRFTDVVSLEQPSLVPSVLTGNVQDVAFDSVQLAGISAREAADLPLQVTGGAAEASFAATGPAVHVSSPSGLLRPGQRIVLEAVSSSSTAAESQYRWSFGDGTHASGRKVKHRFPDTQGTLLDGSGRYRVLLEISTPAGRHSWTYVPVVVSESLLPAQAGYAGSSAPPTPGLHYLYEETATEAIPGAGPVTGTSPTLELAAVPHRPDHYSVTWTGNIDVPVDGGYTFAVIANDAATLEIDGRILATAPEPFAQVCGLAGNAARWIRSALPLAKGRHSLKVTAAHSTGEDNFRVLWEGPGFLLQPLPAAALSHVATADQNH